MEKAREEEVAQRKAKKKKEEEEEDEKLKRKIAEKAKDVPQTPVSEQNASSASEAAGATATGSSEVDSDTAGSVTISEALRVAPEQPPTSGTPSALPPAPVEDAIASSTPNDTLGANQESVASISSTAARMAEDLAAAISSHLQSRGVSGTAMSSAMQR